MGFYLLRFLISAVVDMETRGRDLRLAAEAETGTGMWVVTLRGRHGHALGHSHTQGMHQLGGS